MGTGNTGPFYCQTKLPSCSEVQLFLTMRFLPGAGVTTVCPRPLWTDVAGEGTPPGPTAPLPSSTLGNDGVWAPRSGHRLRKSRETGHPPRTPGVRWQGLRGLPVKAPPSRFTDDRAGLVGFHLGQVEDPGWLVQGDGTSSCCGPGPRWSDQQPATPGPSRAQPTAASADGGEEP